ncbi:hypothetical protein CFBP4996_19755 [Agrobacterium leguminum]|jgi:hypothetical protein|uniref:Uncharacterized protein n=1 Tax=Agrobacterium deltaense NCPPB 1641 TaxID=1183425 RepID=A0A1S7TWP2_9HYPH|nr:MULTISPECIES: hypothetical protein [Agrobacterium]WFS68252.1 hypothetical protein CFBP4996_19755 [Agrobacterium leguminum]CVI58770.1 hypothetical protein AGR7A_Lc120247 [Agrobacterium deltaense NCPPB 1641]
MSTYCVAFRIAAKTVNGKTYDDRRQSVIDAVYTKGAGYWEEMTSFFLVSSPLSTSAFIKAASAGLSKADDLLLIFDPSDMSMGYFGNFSHPDVLKSFFVTAQKA